MIRLALLLALLSCGCDEDLPKSDDAGQADCSRGGRCASRGLECATNGELCFCDGGWWHCRSPLCPPADGPRGACQAPLGCDYDFEWACGCIAPENQWLCCGGVNLCPRDPVEGQLCCGGWVPFDPGCRSSCVAGIRRVCRCEQNHFRCDPEACPDGGI